MDVKVVSIVFSLHILVFVCGRASVHESRPQAMSDGKESRSETGVRSESAFMALCIDGAGGTLICSEKTFFAFWSDRVEISYPGKLEILSILLLTTTITGFSIALNLKYFWNIFIQAAQARLTRARVQVELKSLREESSRLQIEVDETVAANLKLSNENFTVGRLVKQSKGFSQRARHVNSAM